MADRQKRSVHQERLVARRLGGRRQPASGATPWAKHDVRTDDFLIETKYTDRGSYTIRVRDWEALRYHAYTDGRLPMLIIELGGRRLVVTEEGDL